MEDILHLLRIQRSGDTIWSTNILQTVQKPLKPYANETSLSAYPYINISVYTDIRIAGHQTTVGDTALPPGQQRPGGTARPKRERRKNNFVASYYTGDKCQSAE